ncbi:zinc finger HIT domain-containing protein 2 [Diabrotica undecimpunctata]|uniref:zinc finger HIT domain-containing protein 2 n=1 Tax=Diabrotica undecimpunctata TaxID=50387 RepID=UPI003B63CF86
MSSSKIIELDETNTCKICDNALAKYSCPKCNLLYCSLNCYQANSHLECSESFYKDNVFEELKFDKESPESKEKMVEILKRFHDRNLLPSADTDESFGEYSGFSIEDILNFDPGESDELDSDDEDEMLDIGERLQGVNLDDAEKVWDKLTDSEKQDFVAFLKSEDVSNLIPSWQPWWMVYNPSLVEEVEKVDDYKKDCPEIGSIKDFSKLSSKAPAECVKYNLINILTGYAFTTRYFNGEHFEFPHQAVSCIVTISLTMKVGQVFEDFETAVKSVEQECINSDWIMTDSENIEIMRQDIERILKGPKKSEPKFYILCALSDINHLLNNSLKETNDAKTSDGFSKLFPNHHFPSVKLEQPDKIKTHIKKIDYFLSYTNDLFES